MRYEPRCTIFSLSVACKKTNLALSFVILGVYEDVLCSGFTTCVSTVGLLKRAAPSLVMLKNDELRGCGENLNRMSVLQRGGQM